MKLSRNNKSLTVAGLALSVLMFGFLSAAKPAMAEDQAHMQRALAALQTAQSELQAAAHDKGGHRARALEIVGRAINQVQMGIAVGDKH